MNDRLNQVLAGNQDNYILPFFWQHGEEETILREEIARIQESNIHAVCVESRPHPDFLGEGWWRDMDIIMDECRKRRMEVWILDDEKFPSGYAAGMIPKKYPDRGRLFLYEKHIDVIGPQKGVSLLLNLSEIDRLLAVVTGQRTGCGDAVKGELVDITSQVVDDVVYWDIPKGVWRVFYMYLSRNNRSGKPDPYLNPLTPEGTQVLIDAVYESHYERYKEDFGKTFRGFFSDEPQFGNSYGYHASIGRVPFMPMPWCDGLEARIAAAMGEKSCAARFSRAYGMISERKPIRCGIPT